MANFELLEEVCPTIIGVLQHAKSYIKIFYGLTMPPEINTISLNIDALNHICEKFLACGSSTEPSMIIFNLDKLIKSMQVSSTVALKDTEVLGGIREKLLYILNALGEHSDDQSSQRDDYSETQRNSPRPNQLPNRYYMDQVKKPQIYAKPQNAPAQTKRTASVSTTRNKKNSRSKKSRFI